METITKSDNEVKVSVEERDLLSVFMFGQAGLLSIGITWNVLMPIVQRIRTHEANLTGREIPFINQYLSKRHDIFYSMTEKNISETVNAVVEFIKWHNANSQTP